MRVDFLVAGVQKGATTALHEFLSKHPQLYLPEKKELHFFDDEKLDWHNPPYEDSYHSYFRGAPPDRLRGEATPIYTYWPTSARRIRDYNERVKLIVSLRDPVMRAYSGWRMVRSWGQEPLTFSEAIRSGRDRVRRGDEIEGYHRMYSYVERGFYAAQIEHLLEFFDRDQMLFVTSHLLKTRPLDTLNEVFDFLGVDRFEDAPEPRIVFSHGHVSEAPLEPVDVRYLRALYREDQARTQELIGREIPAEI